MLRAAGHAPNMRKSKPGRRIALFDALSRQIVHPACASRRAHLL
ncbi:protein of unknown function [Burkholderia multivorans]